MNQILQIKQKKIYCQIICCQKTIQFNTELNVQNTNIENTSLENTNTVDFNNVNTNATAKTSTSLDDDSKMDIQLKLKKIKQICPLKYQLKLEL